MCLCPLFKEGVFSISEAFSWGLLGCVEAMLVSNVFSFNEPLVSSFVPWTPILLSFVPVLSSFAGLFFTISMSLTKVKTQIQLFFAENVELFEMTFAKAVVGQWKREEEDSGPMTLSLIVFIKQTLKQEPKQFLRDILVSNHTLGHHLEGGTTSKSARLLVLMEFDYYLELYVTALLLLFSNICAALEAMELDSYAKTGSSAVQIGDTSLSNPDFSIGASNAPSDEENISPNDLELPTSANTGPSNADNADPLGESVTFHDGFTEARNLCTEIESMNMIHDEAKNFEWKINPTGEAESVVSPLGEVIHILDFLETTVDIVIYKLRLFRLAFIIPMLVLPVVFARACLTDKFDILQNVVGYVFTFVFNSVTSIILQVCTNFVYAIMASYVLKPAMEGLDKTLKDRKDTFCSKAMAMIEEMNPSSSTSDTATSDTVTSELSPHEHSTHDDSSPTLRSRRRACCATRYDTEPV